MYGVLIVVLLEAFALCDVRFVVGSMDPDVWKDHSAFQLDCLVQEMKEVHSVYKHQELWSQQYSITSENTGIFSMVLSSHIS